MTMRDRALIADITGFWRAAGFDAWFRKDPAFDSDFRNRFEVLHFRAARREFDHWIDDPEGALALFILLDQFPRNTFRNTGHMYATDPLARHYARIALDKGCDRQVEQDVRVFFYLPFSHSEDLADQILACDLNENLGGESLKHALGHRDIIERFGRFPHRNAILGRDSTPEELAFLADGGFAG
jgi:uncharacterized protein (DUF924 family)